VTVSEEQLQALFTRAVEAITSVKNGDPLPAVPLSPTLVLASVEEVRWLKGERAGETN